MVCVEYIRGNYKLPACLGSKLSNRFFFCIKKFKEMKKGKKKSLR